MRIKLIPIGGDEYKATGIGMPAFWPHDGDIVRHNDIAWLKDIKGWTVEIVSPEIPENREKPVS